MLSLWGYTPSAFCSICGVNPCTTHHIISNCTTALVSGRYTWRHDSVLHVFFTAFSNRIGFVNATCGRRKPHIPHISKSFVSKGISSPQPHKMRRRKSLLDGASDWEMLVDFERAPIVFPPEIYSTSERPDIIIWSKALRKLILIELTCPAEEGIAMSKFAGGSLY